MSLVAKIVCIFSAQGDIMIIIATTIITITITITTTTTTTGRHSPKQGDNSETQPMENLGAPNLPTNIVPTKIA